MGTEASEWRQEAEGVLNAHLPMFCEREEGWSESRSAGAFGGELGRAVCGVQGGVFTRQV